MWAHVRFWLLIALLSSAGCSTTQQNQTEDEQVTQESKQPAAIEPQPTPEPSAEAKKQVVDMAKEKAEEAKPVAEPAQLKTPEPQPIVKAPAPVVKHGQVEQAVKRDLPTDPNTFLVVTEPKTSNHPNFGHGSDHGFTVNGEQGKELVVIRGEEYTFSVDTGVKHNLFFV